MWESEFDNIVSKTDKLHDININQLKLKVNESYKEDVKLTTNFSPSNDEDVINKACLDEKLSKIDSHLSLLDNGCKEYILQYNKHSVEEVVIQTAVKTTIQILYDKGILNDFPNADKI